MENNQTKDIQEGIIEGNKSILKFVGGAISKDGKECNLRQTIYEDIVGSMWFPVNETLFHSSWDWLMPVIIKFRSLDLDNTNYKSHVQEIDNCVTDAYDINQAFPAVVNAIQWYQNKNK